MACDVIQNSVPHQLLTKIYCLTCGAKGSTSYGVIRQMLVTFARLKMLTYDGIPIKRHALRESKTFDAKGSLLYVCRFTG